MTIIKESPDSTCRVTQISSRSPCWSLTVRLNLKDREGIRHLDTKCKYDTHPLGNNTESKITDHNKDQLDNDNNYVVLAMRTFIIYSWLANCPLYASNDQLVNCQLELIRSKHI